MYVDYVYEIVSIDCKDLDAIYKDYIITIVGEYGFEALVDNKLLESCGIVNGRMLYTLLSRK